MPKGGFTSIHSTIVKGKIIVTIKDTGIGIPKERLPNIGQPFFTLKEKGTGLGLMTTMRIIENHKGTFNIDSIEGKGTTVTIEFPQP
jgi:signal transduction histidine kinase